MEFVYQGREEKVGAYEEILRLAQVSDAEVAFVADDLPDLPVLRRVGLAIAVANAVPEVKRVAHLVTRGEGGNAAVREAIEFILKAQGQMAVSRTEGPRLASGILLTRRDSGGRGGSFDGGLLRNWRSASGRRAGPTRGRCSRVCRRGRARGAPT